MKKYVRILAFILVLALGVGLCGCAAKDSLAINAHKWEFSAVQDRRDGGIIYASPAEQEAYGGVYALAMTLELSCKVSKKELVLKNKADGQSWAFAYTMQSELEDSYIYDLTMGEVTGATVREDITARIFERFCVGK